MNVPIKPAADPEKVIFLWPGINPVGGQGGMMQPVLTYGVDYGQGSATEWGMANWFTDCPKSLSEHGYCHDQYLQVAEGDTIEFAMTYKNQTFENGSYLWEMSWHALEGGQSSNYMVYWEKQPVMEIWATEAEIRFDDKWELDTSTFDKLPQSSFYTWDLQATTASGTPYPLSFQPDASDDYNVIKTDCDLTIGDWKHVTRLTFPEGDCHSQWYTRSYDSPCRLSSQCGCVNSDGTRKIQCDYCCWDDGHHCHHAQGPTPSTVGIPHGVNTSVLPRPGQSSQHRSHYAQQLRGAHVR